LEPGTARLLAALDLSSRLFLLAAGLSFLLSVGLWFGGAREEGVFVGLWVPSILSLGAFYQAVLAARIRS